MQNLDKKRELCFVIFFFFILINWFTELLYLKKKLIKSIKKEREAN